MKTTNAEKEWYRRMSGMAQDETAEKEEHTTIAATSEPKKKDDKKNGGFSDVAGMDSLKQLVTEGFINVLRNRKCAKAFGVRPPALLLYGPAGCGKTFFAEAIANEVGLNFMKVVPDDLASTLVHGTQEKIGEVFRKAERNGPTIIFFDEFDAMVPQRTSDDRGYQNGETNEFLCMLNNSADKGVYVLAATNHPERIDKAILRTGRIDEMIYVDMPDATAREELFRLALAKLPAEEGIDCARLASLTKGYNCSDISYIIRIASRKMFNETIARQSESYQLITQELLEETIAQRSPSITSRDLREYERVRNQFSPNDAGAKKMAVGFC